MKIGALDDLECPGADLGDGVGRLLALAAVGEDAFDEREQASRPAQQWNGSVTILDIAGSDEDVQQEAESRRRRWERSTSVPLLTEDSQTGADLRVCADEKDRTDIDQRC